MTGTPGECAKKLEISRSRFYEFLEELKLMEIPVEYDKEVKSYNYSSPGEFKIGFESKLEVLDDSSLSRITGGSKVNNIIFMRSVNTGHTRDYFSSINLDMAI